MKTFAASKTLRRWIILGIPAMFVFYILSSGPVLRIAPPRLGVAIYTPVIDIFGASPLWQPWLEFWGVSTSRSACINNLRQIDDAISAWGATNSVSANTNTATKR